MTSWLLAQLLPLSLLLLALLAWRPLLIRLGLAQLSYLLWLSVPMLLIGSLLPKSAQLITATQPLQTMLVNSEHRLTQAISTDWWGTLWLAGALLGALWLLVNTLQFQRIAHLATPRDPNLPHIRFSRAVDGAVVTGLWRPVILLPTDFNRRFNTEEKQLILAHEQRHIARFDLVSNAVALTLLLLFWFHPLAWLSYRAFRRDQELSCDADVLASQAKTMRLHYCRAMVKSAGSDQRYPAMLIHYGEKSMLATRINHSRRLFGLNRYWQLGLAALVACTSINLSYAGNKEKIVEEVIEIEAHSSKKGDVPKPIMRIEPDFPEVAAREHITGSVTLYYDIEPDGSVSNISVAESKPEGVFDKVATDALSQWRYSETEKGMKNTGIVLEFEIDSRKNLERLEVTQ